MAGLAQPSTYSMDATTPPSIISMDAAVPPSTSVVAAPAPSTSTKAAPAPPSNSPTAGPAQPSNSPTAGPAQPPNSPTAGPAQPPNSPMAGPAQPSISSMPAPTPPSNSTMAVAGEAHKKRPGYELPRSGCKKKKKNKKIAAVQEEHAKGASPRVYSPKIVASSPGVNMLAKSAALKRASSAVRHASSKRAKSSDQLETPASQRTPSIDVQTRWNSTYLMLESAMPFRTAFDALGQQEKDYEFCPTPNEWKMAEAACKLLKVFYTTTKLLSGSNYPTSHLYFPQLCKIKKILKRESSSKNNTIAHMVQQMEIKLEKYWKESFKSICVPVVIDPRFKFDLLEYMLKDFGSETEANIWMHKSKRAIQKLFDEYSREIPVNHQQQDCGSPRAEEDEEDDDPLAEWDHYITCKKGQATNGLDQYLKEELYPRKKELDILEWWKINSPKYPVLFMIARDILAISASTVPSESAFSSGGRIVSDYRSSLSCSTVEALICLQDWLRAADPQKYKGASLGPEEEE